MNRWVAVAYDENFYVGQITSLCDEDVKVNFLTQRKDGQYKWPKPKDIALVSTKYVFCSTPRVQKVGANFVLHNQDQVKRLYKHYKLKYLK